MPKQISAQEATRQFQTAAQTLWDELDHWWEEHPEATLTEIERFLQPRRRQLMGQTVALQFLKRGAGALLEAPACPHCGQPMEHKGIREKPTVGLEFEGKLPRVYYYCPPCHRGFFPPQRPAAVDERTVE